MLDINGDSIITVDVMYSTRNAVKTGVIYNRRAGIALMVLVARGDNCKWAVTESSG